MVSATVSGSPCAEAPVSARNNVNKAGFSFILGIPVTSKREGTNS